MKKFLLACLLAPTVWVVQAQQPGVVVRPSSGTTPVALDPNGNRYTSATTTGFTTSDITQSEIPYKIIKPLFSAEPTGDLATGPSGGYSDIVKTLDGSGCYMYYDGANILFRIRIGGIVSGAKAYNILIDTDMKLGATGPNADPNYVAPTNSGNGNPGFEWEVALETGSTGRVAVYNVNGIINPSAAVTYGLSTNQLISVALTRESNDADYFYDFFVPASDLGLNATTPFRVVVSTNTNPGSAFQGTRSDIYGINDTQFPNATDAWQYVGTNSPSFTLNDVSLSGSGPGAACTAAPVLSSEIAAGTNVTVGGTWTKLVGSSLTSASITVYKNGVSQGTTTCNTGSTWSFIIPSIATGDVITAAAQATGESMCLLSNSVVATSCSPANTSASTGAAFGSCVNNQRGMAGTKLSGSVVRIYSIAYNATPTLFATDGTPASPSTYNITYSTATTWEYNGANNGGTVDPCSGGANDIANGSYYITVQETGKCESAPIWGSCVNLTASTTPTITQTTLFAGINTITGTNVQAAVVTMRLFVNGFLVASSNVASGAGYSFSNVVLQTGDVVTVRAQASGQCISPAVSRTVTCFTSAPIIATDVQGNLIAGSTTVSGTSSEPAGTSIRVFLSPSTQIGTANVSSDGTWSASVLPALANGSVYYATAQNGSCAISANSASATARTITSICPSITGTYNEGASTVSGTLPSSFTGTVYLYQDGSQIGSVAVTAATSWSISITAANPLYAGGVLTAGAQATGGTLNRSCASTTTVGCSVPASPGVDPTTASINAGESMVYNVTGTITDVLYSVNDAATGAVNYAPSSFGTGGTLQFTTNIFNNPGTYNLKVNALSLSGTGCVSSASMTLTVNGLLPLTWLGFDARHSEDKVLLEWWTIQEKNVREFVIQHSADGQQWSSIGQLPARNGGSAKEQYQYLHNTPAIGVNFYRIQQRDKDGKNSFSPIQKLYKQASATSLRVYPNPVAGQRLLVQLAQSGMVELYDEKGRLLMRSYLQAGTQPLDIQQLPTGVYLLRNTDAQVRFVKQ